MNTEELKELAELLFPEVSETPADMEAKFPPRNLPEGAVVSRMAPSPTGFVHLGNLVQGLISERMCHQSGGLLYLRVEDTDAKREVPGAVEVLIDAMKHYGIHFDEGATIDGDNGIYGPYRQRQRASVYHVYAKQLVLQGEAYPCFCTEEELTAIHEKQEAEKANFGYFGKWAVWRDRSLADIKAELAAGHPHVLRYRSTGSIENKIKFTDLVKGNLEVTENDMDHVLLKSDGIPTYHFAHAVDDHLMHTTHVVRGDEWLPSLPFHLQLFHSLGFKPPKYLHIGPLQKMDGESKRKLSKRKDPELALTYYAAAGFPIQSVYEYLMTVLNSNFEDWRRANPDTDVNEFKFSFKKMNPAGALFDEAKLRDVSKNVLSRMGVEEIYALISEFAKQYDGELYNHLCADEDYAKQILAIGRGGKKPRKDFATFTDVKPYLDFFYDDWFKIADTYPETFKKEDIKKALSLFAESYDVADDMNVWFEKIKTVADTLGFASDMKLYKENPAAYPGNVADISMFLRVAVTGKLNSPDMYAVMQVLGAERVQNRIAKMINEL